MLHGLNSNIRKEDIMLIAHPDAHIKNAFEGLKGKNIMLP